MKCHCSQVLLPGLSSPTGVSACWKQLPAAPVWHQLLKHGRGPVKGYLPPVLQFLCKSSSSQSTLDQSQRRGRVLSEGEIRKRKKNRDRSWTLQIEEKSATHCHTTKEESDECVTLSMWLLHRITRSRCSCHLQEQLEFSNPERGMTAWIPF